MKLYIYLISFLIISCPNKSNIHNEDIMENWYPQFEKNISEEYFEMYLDNDFIYYYGPYGLLPRKKYHLKDNSIYIENPATAKMEKKGEVNITEGIFTITTEDGDYKYLRVVSNLSLSDLIKGKIKEEILEVAFSKRLNEWQ